MTVSRAPISPAVQALHDYVMIDWPEKVKASGLKDPLDRKQFPRKARNWALKCEGDPMRLYRTLQGVIEHPQFITEGSPGWDQYIGEGDPSLVVEWVVVDKQALWASLFTAEDRYRVMLSVANTYLRLR